MERYAARIDLWNIERFLDMGYELDLKALVQGFWVLKIFTVLTCMFF
jgi:hypothetical protein